MGVFTYETETTYSIPPARLFKASILDGDNLILKLAPEAIKSIEILEGNGGAGTIKKFSFGEGSQHKYAKQQVDAVDAHNFTYNYTVIEGDAFGDVVEKINYEIKLVASADGGSIVKIIINYHTKGDHQIKEEYTNGAKQRASHYFKAVEAYLVANPDAYN